MMMGADQRPVVLPNNLHILIVNLPAHLGEIWIEGVKNAELAMRGRLCECRASRLKLQVNIVSSFAWGAQ